MSEVTIDGELAAMALNIIHRGRALLELGLEAYEFGGAEEEYERRFATGQRAYHRLQIYRRDPMSLARYLYRRHVRPPHYAAYKRARRAGVPDPRTVHRRRRRAG